jgi:hypothetical protein
MCVSGHYAPQLLSSCVIIRGAYDMCLFWGSVAWSQSEDVDQSYVLLVCRKFWFLWAVVWLAVWCWLLLCVGCWWCVGRRCVRIAPSSTAAPSASCAGCGASWAAAWWRRCAALPMCSPPPSCYCSLPAARHDISKQADSIVTAGVSTISSTDTASELHRSNTYRHQMHLIDVTVASTQHVVTVRAIETCATPCAHTCRVNLVRCWT